MDIVEASTISAKIWMSYLVMSEALAARPKKTGMSFSSSGPRTKGTPKRSLRRSRSARQRPGSMILSASTGFGSRRAMISSVIKAATFTPMSSTFQAKLAFMPSSTASSRGRARCPVRKRMLSAIDGPLGAKPVPTSTPPRRQARGRGSRLNALALVDGCAARPAHIRKPCREGSLIAAAEQEHREACVPQHGGEGLVDDTVAGELPGAELGVAPLHGLDHVAARGTETPPEPQSEAVRGDDPGLRDVAAVGDEAVGRP